MLGENAQQDFMPGGDRKDKFAAAHDSLFSIIVPRLEISVFATIFAFF